MEDSDLIRRLQAGERTAFDELVRAYQTLVISTCYSFLTDRADAEDVAQEVFMEVFRSIHRFRGDAKLSTWLYRIAVNKSLNHKRKHKYKRYVSSLQSFFTGTESDSAAPLDIPDYAADYPAEEAERARLLHKAVDSLPENQRIAFTLHKFDELPYKEVAEIMGTSLSSVESLMHRAKRNLQKKLLTYYREDHP